MLPPVMLPVADINPPVNKLLPVMLAPVMAPVADIRPPVRMLLPVMLPPVTVPVVDIVFEPNAAKNVAALAFV